MAECDACGKPVPDTAYVCHPCAFRDDKHPYGLAPTLRDAAELWPELETTITGQARMAEPGPRPRGRTPPQPIRPDIGAREVPGGDPCYAEGCDQPARYRLTAAWNGKPILVCPDHQHAADRQDGMPTGLPMQLYAAEVRDTVRNTVTTWARLIAEERGTILPVGRTPTVLGWLADQLGWARYQKWAGELWDELGYACSRIAPAVDRPRPRVDAGPCLSDTAGGPCRQRLSAGPRAVIIRCPVCRTTWNAIDRSATILAAAADIRLTAEEAADLLTLHGRPTQAATVRQWGKRGRALAVAGRYRFGDVHDLRLAMDQRMSRSAA